MCASSDTANPRHVLPSPKNSIGAFCIPAVFSKNHLDKNIGNICDTPSSTAAYSTDAKVKENAKPMRIPNQSFVQLSAFMMASDGSIKPSAATVNTRADTIITFSYLPVNLFLMLSSIVRDVSEVKEPK
mmetsp:Transcript_40911/g.109817  ORF Transcript_40911/g.109817 Transcript_40911/m.109817 type:complete len:129 (+) Transcript_40911:309-695(+)